MKSEILSQRIRQSLLPMATNIEKQINKRSARMKKWGLLLFGLVTAFICFFQMAQALRSSAAFPVEQDHITLPHKISPETKAPVKPMTEGEIIKKFNAYIDSLNANTKN